MSENHKSYFWLYCLFAIFPFFLLYLFGRDDAIEHSSNTEYETDALHREFIAIASFQLLSLVGLLHLGLQCTF